MTRKTVSQGVPGSFEASSEVTPDSSNQEHLTEFRVELSEKSVFQTGSIKQSP